MRTKELSAWLPLQLPKAIPTGAGDPSLYTSEEPGWGRRLDNV